MSRFRYFFVPSVWLMSAKFWLWTIFSTMSSASMRVSFTQEGWLSTESCFLLKHSGEWRLCSLNRTRLPITRPSVLCVYLGGLFGGKTGRGGRGGLSGRPASLSPSGGVSTVKHKPPEVLLPVEVFLRCVRSDRLEEQECSVLYPAEGREEIRGCVRC